MRNVAASPTHPLIYPVLLALTSAGAVLSLADVASPLRAILGLVTALFVPGFLLVGALFPRTDEVPFGLRLGLSFGLSFVFQPIIALLLTFAGLPLRREQLVLALEVLVLVVGVVAWARSQHLASPTLRFIRFDRRLVPAALFVVAATIATIAGVDAAGRALSFQPAITEFYVVGFNADFGSTSVVASPGTTLNLALGINNHEGHAVDYIVTPRSNGRVIGAARTVTVADGDRWQGMVSFVVPSTNGKSAAVPVDLVLERADLPGAYRTARIWIDLQQDSPVAAPSK